MVVQVSVVLRRTVCGDIDWCFDNLSGSHLTLMMTSTQVVKTSVNVTTNSPSQDYTHLDNHHLPTYDSTKLNFANIQRWHLCNKTWRGEKAVINVKASQKHTAWILKETYPFFLGDRQAGGAWTFLWHKVRNLNLPQGSQHVPSRYLFEASAARGSHPLMWLVGGRGVGKIRKLLS